VSPGEPRPIGQVRQTEVSDLHLALAGKQDVAALDVAMNDAFSMRLPQSLGYLNCDVESIFDLERALADAVGQLPAVHIRHRQVNLPVRFAEFVHRTNIRMVERRCRLRLSQKSGPASFHLAIAECDKFQGDGPVQASVEGLVDDAHSAFAQFFDDPVLGNCPTDHRPCRSNRADNITRPGGSTYNGQSVVVRAKNRKARTAARSGPSFRTTCTWC
jgi:hypothetical protein